MTTKQADKIVIAIQKRIEPHIVGIVSKAMKSVNLRKFSDHDKKVLRQVLAYRASSYLTYRFAMESLQEPGGKQ